MLVLPVCLYPPYLLTSLLFFSFLQKYYIFYRNYIGIPHFMLPNLQLLHFFVCPIIENFKKVFMHHLAMSSIIVYHITIIPNTLNTMAN